MTTATSTAGEIIQDAYLFAGIGDQYNALDANSVAVGLRFLNSLLDSMSNEQFTVFDIQEGTMPLVSGTQTYTLGPSGTNLPAVRPNQIETVNIVDASNVTHPMQILSVEQWGNDIIYKPAPGRPEFVFFNYNPLDITASFWPLPSFSNDVFHYFYSNVLTQFTSGASLLNSPPAYDLFFKTQLAKIIGEINNKPLSAGKLDIAVKAEKNARILNREIQIMDMDVPISDRTAFNIYTGNNNP